MYGAKEAHNNRRGSLEEGARNNRRGYAPRTLMPPASISDIPVGGKWRGVLPDMYNEIAKNLGFQMKEVPLSATSKRLFNLSDWTACAHQVSVGKADLCISTFWETPERREMVNDVSETLSTENL